MCVLAAIKTCQIDSSCLSSGENLSRVLHLLQPVVGFLVLFCLVSLESQVENQLSLHYFFNAALKIFFCPGIIYEHLLKKCHCQVAAMEGRTQCGAPVMLVAVEKRSDQAHHTWTAIVQMKCSAEEKTFPKN